MTRSAYAPEVASERRVGRAKSMVVAARHGASSTSGYVSDADSKRLRLPRRFSFLVHLLPTIFLFSYVVVTPAHHILPPLSLPSLFPSSHETNISCVYFR